MSIRRAAIYARYSTDLQNEKSCEDQIALCRQYAERNGFIVVERYHDAGISGATIAGRPGVQVMLRDAKQSRFDLLIVEAFDRLSRSQADMGEIHRQLEFLGIGLYSVNDGTANTLNVGLTSIIGQYQREEGARKIRRGVSSRVREGKVPGSRAYGYRVTIKRGEPEIDSEQAAVVLRVFNEYVAGRSPRDIAHRLNSEGVKPPRGSKPNSNGPAVWCAATINGNAKRGHGIIVNPIYDGRIVWNRTRMARDPSTGRRIHRANPESEWLTAAAEHLRIVPADVFSAAQARRKADAHVPHGPILRRDMLLKGLLRCGECGGSMIVCDSGGRNGTRIQCSRARECGACSNRRKYSLRHVEDVIVREYRDHMLSPTEMRSRLADWRRGWEASIRELRADKGAFERRLREIRSDSERLVDLVMRGVVPEGAAAGRTQALEAERLSVEAKLAAATAYADSLVTDELEMMREFRAAMSNIGQHMMDPEIGPELREEVRRGIRHIKISPSEDGMKVVIVAKLSGWLNSDPNDRAFWRAAYEAKEQGVIPVGYSLVAEEGLEPPTQGL